MRDGKESTILAYGNYTYRKGRNKSNLDRKVYWRCSKQIRKNCKVALYTLDDVIIDIRREHTH